MQEKKKVDMVLVMVTVLVAMGVILLLMGAWIIRDVDVLSDTTHFDISTPIVDME